MKKCPIVGKRSFSTKEKAQEAADYQQREWSLNKIRVYVCEFCGKYHLTHKKQFKM